MHPVPARKAVAVGDVDWTALRAVALAVAARAHAPYSGFRVGAAALVDDGRTVAGCNVENASYGLTLCAECSLVSDLHMSAPTDARGRPRPGRLVAFVCVNAADEVTMPCGRCRQLLWEFRAPEMLVWGPSGPLPMTAVLPEAFGPDDLS